MQVIRSNGGKALRRRRVVVPVAAIKSASQLLVLVPFLSGVLSAGISAPTTWGPIGSTSDTAVSNGNALNTVLANAMLGDTILLTAGAVFQGPFQLPQKSQPAWATTPQFLTIRTGTPDCPVSSGACLSSDIRVSPKDVSLLAKLVPPASGTSNDSVITTAQSAGYYRLVGLEITTDRYLISLVTLGTWTETTWDQLPHHITIDRCYIHGSYANGTLRGIQANAGQGTQATSNNPYNVGVVGTATPPQDDIVLTNSFIADIKHPTGDSQAFESWNGYGPFRLENNYLEAAGENVMFGGEDPSITNLVPSDIVVRHNHFYKPLEWLNGAQAGKWCVKNHFELKNAQNVLVDGNVFEHNWTGQQRGFGFMLMPRNQSGKSPWSTVQNVTIQNNVIRHMAGGIAVAGVDTTNGSQHLNRVTFSNNLLYDIGVPSSDAVWGLSSNQDVGQAILIENETDQVTFDHNTAFHTTAVSFSSYNPNSTFAFTNNVMSHNYCRSGNNCGMSGANTVPGVTGTAGTGALTTYFVLPYSITNNLLYDGDESGLYVYPAGNYYAGYTSNNMSPSYNVSFNANYSLASPTLANSTGVNATTLADSANIVRYCTSNGASCSGPDFWFAVTPSSATVSPGDSITYKLPLGPVNGFGGTVNLNVSGVPSWAAASFSQSSVTGVGVVDLTVATGTAAAGSYQLTITGQDAANAGLIHTVAVTLTIANPSLSLTVSPTNATIKPGKTQQFTATLNQNGTSQDVTKVATWASSNTSVATVDAGGLATGKTAGTTTISATYKGVTATATLKIAKR